jgi:hypothetical protein
MTESPDEALRTRLSRLDPAGPSVPVDPATSPRAAVLMERAMQSTDLAPVEHPTPQRRRRGPVLWVAATAVAAAAVVLGVLFLGGTGSTGGSGGAQPDEPSTLALSLPPSNAATSCIQFDVTYLRDTQVAFGGTVTHIDAEQVTLDVDRWYKGGDADVVTLAQPDAHSSAALDGVDFRAGERYLVTAYEGIVSGCGFSGPATPQLEDAFDQAFGG